MLREATVITATGAVLAGNLYGRELALDLEGKLCTSLGTLPCTIWQTHGALGLSSSVYSGLPFLLLFVFFVYRGFYTNPPPVLFCSDKQTPNLLSLAMPCLPFPLCPNQFKPVKWSPNE